MRQNYEAIMRRNQFFGFTLIELLIVVAIIAILAAIAVPNLLEAQTRAKVSRVKADQRSIATALESYRVDNNDYILGRTRGAFELNLSLEQFVRWRLRALTTPIAYMGGLPTTPFLPKNYRHSSGILELTYNVGSEYDTAFWRLPDGRVGGNNYSYPGAILAGSNADTTRWHLRDAGSDYEFTNSINGTTNLMPYDPSNGTVSIGDIWRFGP